MSVGAIGWAGLGLIAGFLISKRFPARKIAQSSEGINVGTTADLSELLTPFRETLASIGDAVIVTDPSAKITFMNQAAEHTTGWPQADALRRPLAEVFNIVNEGTGEAPENPVIKAIRDGAVVGLANHTTLITRDGTMRPIDDSAAPIKDAAGKVIGVVLVFHDITERRRTERALAETQEQLIGIIGSATDAIITVDERQTVTLYNTAAEKMFRCPADQAIGRALDQFLPERFRANHREFIQQFGATGISARSMKGGKSLAALRSDGVEFPIDATISQITVEGKKLFTAIIRDVSERDRAERELAKAKEAAEAANRSKSEFLANMSHEIRTPMNAILGFADMVLHKNQDKAARIECAQIIRRNALHLLEIINEILDLSKIEALQMTVERIDCNLPDLLSEITSLMRPRALEKGLGFRVAFAGPIPHTIKTDPLRMRQILINLLGNAIKFTQEGMISMRIADVGTHETGIKLRIDVSDTGIGMRPEQIARLFRPFTQGDESVTRKFGGTGLGLTISLRLAKLLMGDIQVLSDPGKGSTFTLLLSGGPSEGVEMLEGLTEATLPARVDRFMPPNANIQSRILLVEDGRDNQRLLSIQLADAGATVTIAENGKVAIELATTERFDVILMDMQMPVMDGYAATAELRRRGVTIPIIALTAYAMSEDRGRCLACGCSDYLSKPIEEESLLRVISEHLGSAGPTGAAPAAEAALASTGVPGPGVVIRSSLADNPRIRKILPEYVAGLSDEVRNLTELLNQRDLETLKKVAHQLRGAGGGYGFDAITESATKVEESILSAKDIADIAQQVDALIDILRRVEGYVESPPPPDAFEKSAN